MTAVSSNCNSAVVSSDESSQLEILVVQVRVGEFNLRVINSYGPQEDSNLNEITDFWQKIEAEVINAKVDECLVLLQLDANAKVGHQVIKNDPHSTSGNGQILIDLVTRQNMFIVNSLPLCQGVITRDRETVVGREQSVLDYIIVCDSLKEHVVKMIVDDSRLYTLTRYQQGKLTKSDHNILFCSFDIQHRNLRPSLRKEVFKFKDVIGQNNFYRMTSGNNFSNIFSSETTFPQKSMLFYKCLKNVIHKSFSKVRIVNGGKQVKQSKSQVQIMIDKRRELKHS